jgi:hypothetical protein
VRTRLPLGAILGAILLASCGSRPGLAVTIAGVAIPMVLGSTTDRTGCSSEHGDAFPQSVPLTTINAPTPVTLKVEAGQGATEIRGWIYDLDASSPSGGPTEEFTLSGRTGTYAPRSIIAARTYQVVLNVRWSFVVTDGEVTHLFRLRIGP